MESYIIVITRYKAPLKMSLLYSLTSNDFGIELYTTPPPPIIIIIVAAHGPFLPFL